MNRKKFYQICAGRLLTVSAGGAAAACEEAVAQGVEAFWLDASLTAVPFYKALSLTSGEATTHDSLPCVRMTKKLSHLE